MEVHGKLTRRRFARIRTMERALRPELVSFPSAAAVCGPTTSRRIPSRRGRVHNATQIGKFKLDLAPPLVVFTAANIPRDTAA